MPPIEPVHPLFILRNNHRAVLTADGTPFNVVYVLDGRTGRPVLSAPSILDESDSLALHVPDEGDDTLHLHVRHTWLDRERDEAADRLLIHVGPGRHPKVAALELLSVRAGGVAFEPGEAQVANPLHALEPSVCKQLNADKAALTDLCRRHAQSEVAEPVAVGLDPHGLTIRTRTGLVRVHAPLNDPLSSPQAAHAWIEHLRAR